MKADKACDTVLLSGEDFENAIVDLTLAREIEAQAKAAGFDEIVWVVVNRDKYDYAASIYAEKSKHGIVLQRNVVTKALEQRGCLYVATQNYNYIFALDFERFKERFVASLTGELWTYSMQDFLAVRPGDILLKRLMGQALHEDFETSAEYRVKIKNRRLSSQTVEMNYLFTILGLTRERYRRFPLKPIFALLARLRSQT